MSDPEVTDVLEVLADNNRNVFKDLLFANKCLNLLIEFKSFIDLVYNRLQSDIDSNECQKYQELCLKVDELLEQKPLSTSDGQSVDKNCDNLAKDCGEKHSIDSRSVEVLPKKSKKLLKKNSENEDKHNSDNSRTVESLPIGQQSEAETVDNRRFRCTICKKRFGSRGTVKRHLKLIHDVCDDFCELIEILDSDDDNGTDNTAISTIECNVCHKVWDNKRKMSKHMRQVHGIDNPLRRKPKDPLPAANSLRFRCTVLGCDKAFVSKDYLYRHEVSTHGERRYVCQWPGCEYRATMRQYIREHMEGVHTSERAFPCSWPDCDKRFKTILTMRRHLDTHAPQKKFVCSWPGCQYATPCNNSLRRHEMIHTKEKPYACEWPGCEYRSAYKTEVIRHRSVHSDERNFVCDVLECGKRFKTKDSLSQHKQVHVSPYVCCVKSCSAHFSVDTELEQHLSAAHPERAIRCTHSGCYKRFESERLLSRHLVHVHQQNEQWRCDYPGCQFITGFKGSFKRHRITVHHN